MSVTLPGNSVVTVRHEYRWGTDVSFNVLHYRAYSMTNSGSGLPVATEPLANVALPGLAAAAYTAWAEAWDDAVSEDVTYTGCTVQKTFPGDRSTPFHYVPEVAAIGASESESLPMQDAVTILKKTDYGQRWGLGRLFLSGLPESFVNGGYITNAEVDALAALLTLIGSDITHTTDGVIYVWRPVVTNVPTSGYPRVNDITSVALSDRVVKSQKRRRPGKGI